MQNYIIPYDRNFPDVSGCDGMTPIIHSPWRPVHILVCTNKFANQDNKSHVIDEEVKNIIFNIAQKVQDMLFINIVILEVEMYHTSLHCTNGCTKWAHWFIVTYKTHLGEKCINAYIYIQVKCPKCVCKCIANIPLYKHMSTYKKLFFLCP